MTTALDEIAKLLGRIDTAGGFATRRTCRPQSLRLNGEGVGRVALPVAEPLADPETAAALLQPFALSDLTARLAPRLSGLLDTYGFEWCRSLVRRWLTEEKGYEPPETRIRWVNAALVPIVRALATRKSPGQSLAAELLICNDLSSPRVS